MQKPDTQRSDAFRASLFVIEDAVEKMSPGQFDTDPHQPLSQVYTNMKDIVMDALSVKVPEVHTTYTRTSTEANNTADLIVRALHTSKSAGLLINKFYESTSGVPQDLTAIQHSIKPVIRDLLRFNLSFNHLTITFGGAGYTKGLGLNEAGQIEIVGPSYLNTAKELSEHFEDEVRLQKFQARYRSVQSRLKENSPEVSDHFWDPLAKYIVCNPVEQFTALTDSIFQATEPVISNTEEANNIGEKTQRQLLWAIATEDGSAMHLNIGSLLDRDLPAILAASPLKDMLIQFKSSESFYPTLCDVDSIDPTVGCPGYFHNLAIKYVAKGIYINNMLKSE